jgi:hypothetical protein
MGIRCAAIAGPVRGRRATWLRAGADAPVHAQARGSLRRGQYKDVEKQLHRHVLYHVERGDMVVVDARPTCGRRVRRDDDLLQGQGGAGMVIDGCLRDWPNIAVRRALWMRGVTPNFHTQTDLMPFAVNARSCVEVSP